MFWNIFLIFVGRYPPVIWAGQGWTFWYVASDIWQWEPLGADWRLRVVQCCCGVRWHSGHVRGVRYKSAETNIAQWWVLIIKSHSMVCWAQLGWPTIKTAQPMLEFVLPPGERREDTLSPPAYWPLFSRRRMLQSPSLLSVFMSFPDKHQVRFEDIDRL